MPKVNLQGVNLQDTGTAFGDYMGQSGSFPGLTSMVSGINQTDMDQYVKLLNQLYPGVTSQLGQVSNIANSYLTGQIPQDVQSQIQRATAQQANQGGYGGMMGAGTMGGNLGLRNVGLTSAFGQKTGLEFMQAGLGTAGALIPNYINPGSLLFTPAQLQARRDQADYYNTDVHNQQQIINAQSQAAGAYAQMAQQRQQNAALGNMFSGIFGSGSNPSGLSKALGGSLGNLFGGGNLNPNFNLNYADLTAQGQGFTSYAAGEAAGAI